jgi:DNA-binding response OmpR family regulator
VSKVKILIADDDRVVLFTLAEGLREADFDVLEARDGLQALDLCRSEAPALALLDIRMPGLDGLELARRLREETEVPFLFFSAYSDEAFVRRAVESGALGYLLKPLNVPALLPMVRTALARSRDFSGLQGCPGEQPHALRRSIATVGMLMHADGLDQDGCLRDKLRQQARGQRRKLEDVATAMIGSRKPSKPR